MPKVWETDLDQLRPDGDVVRPDHPSSLPSRIADLDARLRSGGAVRTIATLTVSLLVLQGAVVLDRATGEAGPSGSVEVAALELEEGAAADTALAGGVAPVGDSPSQGTIDAPSAATGSAAPAAAGGGDATTDAPTVRDAAPATVAPRSAPARAAAAPAASDPAQRRFEERFPAHARARQNVRDPRTTRWAVLIGVNEHSGRTRDNLGSRQDAEDLYRHLVSLGWAKDRIVLLTDGNATRENIVEALQWLGRKTNGDSVAIVHYSGHTKQWHGRDADGDREVPDEAFWPSDNRFITDREVGDLMAQVRAGRLWFNVGACEAAGFDDWGTTGPNRIATYSSGEREKSYEDPRRGNSVWGYYLIEEGLLGGHADANGDGNVTVEEAFRYATPRAHSRTRGQSHGRQTPETIDRLEGDFDLRIPPKPRAERPSSQQEDNGGKDCLLCAPAAVPTVRLR